MMEPTKRLGSEAEAKAWLDTIVTAYVRRSGISLSVGGAAGGSGGGSQGAMINSEEFIKFQADQEQFAPQHIELYMRYLKRDSRSGDIAFDKEKANSVELQAKLDSIAKEHGDTYIEGIQPVFDPLKARRFDSSWNWVRQDALVMYYDVIFGRLTTVDREITARCISLFNRGSRLAHVHAIQRRPMRCIEGRHVPVGKAVRPTAHRQYSRSHRNASGVQRRRVIQ
jgi:fatty acid synthase subunit beta